MSIERTDRAESVTDGASMDTQVQNVFNTF